MDYEKVKKIDVTDDKQLNNLRYREKVYYCGNSNWQRFYTLVRKKLSSHGVSFPYNRACFVHDLMWRAAQTPEQYDEADKVFLQNMRKLLSQLDIPRRVKFYLIIRLYFFYYAVRFLNKLKQ